MMTSTGGSRRSAACEAAACGSDSAGPCGAAPAEDRASRMNLRSGEVGALNAGGREVGWYMCAGKTVKERDI